MIGLKTSSPIDNIYLRLSRQACLLKLKEFKKEKSITLLVVTTHRLLLLQKTRLKVLEPKEHFTRASPAVIPWSCVSVRHTSSREVRPTRLHRRRPYSSLTEFEESIPGPAEVLPGFGDEQAEPPREGTGVHGGLERAEHERQGLDVIHGRLRDAVLQAAQTTFIKDGGHSCTGEKLQLFFF